VDWISVAEIRVQLAGCCQHCSKAFSIIKYGSIDVAQAVSRQPLTAEAQVRSQASLCEVCYGHSGSGIVVSPTTSGFPMLVSFHWSSMLIHSSINDGISQQLTTYLNNSAKYTSNFYSNVAFQWLDSLELVQVPLCRWRMMPVALVLVTISATRGTILVSKCFIHCFQLPEVAYGLFAHAALSFRT